MDPQNDKSDIYKKRSFISPQKAQTSIRSFTNSDKQAQKRLNNNPSPKKLLPDIVKLFELRRYFDGGGRIGRGSSAR
jgi:hypothetical protein